MAATVINGKTTRYADRHDIVVMVFETYGGWDIENEWIMSTGCEVWEMVRVVDGLTERETIYIWA
jgi:hypothetical protein